jgi:hypothetical protein
MKASRTLYPPGFAPFVPNPDAKALLVPINRIPRADYETIAHCYVPFEDFLASKGVKGKRIFRVMEGGWYRIVGVSLPSGRFAQLVKYDNYPEYFQVSLQVWREMHVFREDYFLIRELVGVGDESFKMCDGPVLWR